MQMSADRVQQIVDEVLTEKLAGTGFDHAEIKSESDFDGEPVIRVVVSFRGTSSANSALIDSTGIIRDRLLQSGDNRYVYASPRLPESEVKSDEDAETPDEADLQ